MSSSSTPLPTLADYRALSELRHRIRKFVAFSESEARAAGIEPQQHQLLLAVKGLPEGDRATIGTIAGRLLLRHHSVVELADRLEEKGLLVKVQSEQDRREILLKITGRGERLLAKLSMAHQAELSAQGPLLVEALTTLLEPSHGKNAATASTRTASDATTTTRQS